MRESDIEDYLEARAKAFGAEVRKVKWIGRRNAPDRVILSPRPITVTLWERSTNTLWVELKATGVTPRITQLREHERMRAAGQVVLVIDSKLAIDRLFDDQVEPNGDGKWD